MLTLPEVLFCIFLVLKLTSVINWSWWLVTVPLWAPVALAMIFFFFILVVAICVVGFKKVFKKL
jgi:hypothetical protein